MTDVTARRIFSDPVLFMAFGFGSGLAPRAPGTAGTLAAIPLYLWFSQFSQPVFVALLAAVAVSGIWICGQASARLGVHDHPGIVWDEFAGFLVTMALVDATWLSILLGFGLFRLFDICKPWPIKWVDRKIHGGLGIMLDDLLAGVPAAILLWVILQVME